MSDLICISHLRWDEMKQQPQLLPSRLSRQRRIVFVEAPLCVVEDVEPRLEIHKAAVDGLPLVTVVRLIVPELTRRVIGHDDCFVQPLYAQMLAAYLKTERFRDAILWLYSASAVGYAQTIPHKLLVYDVLEQGLLNSSPAVPSSDAESALLQKANIIIYRRSQAMAAAAV